MAERISGLCEDGMHYYIIEALTRKIARDSGNPLPRSGSGEFYEDRAEAIVFNAIVEMIATNSGVGVHNCDQGHPAYATGAKGGSGLGDAPERNRMFRLLQKFDYKHHESIHDLSSWKRFCQLVLGGYRRRNPPYRSV